MQRLPEIVIALGFVTAGAAVPGVPAYLAFGPPANTALEKCLETNNNDDGACRAESDAVAKAHIAVTAAMAVGGIPAAWVASRINLLRRGDDE